MSLKRNRKQEAEVRPLILHVRIHPGLRAALKSAAALDHMTIEEKVHAILCRELDRMDLIDRGPRVFANGDLDGKRKGKARPVVED